MSTLQAPSTSAHALVLLCGASLPGPSLRALLVKKAGGIRVMTVTLGGGGEMAPLDDHLAVPAQTGTAAGQVTAWLLGRRVLHPIWVALDAWWLEFAACSYAVARWLVAPPEFFVAGEDSACTRWLGAFDRVLTLESSPLP